MLWSHLWLNEAINADMLIGAGVVLLGTLLAALPTRTTRSASTNPAAIRSEETGSNKRAA
jgi:drug/metabolite transporter (DMT)-like permease